MSTPTTPEAGGKPARMVTAIVARGRTVMGADGKLVTAGKEVTLLAADVPSLRRAGYLVDPKEPEVARNDGPTIGPRIVTNSTVQIKRG
ncbi:hypothetical protein BLA6993_03600 [Burkholderia lata]|uniref:hypothetical protein n=1 Tax=Burkholderia lata (strain ATCC 17760 / DSM 23089 / LMG 22485 / NCIMB 9086 / R18194 / 383) TaxID=482957 RepID=UPI001452C5EC|nr:hypothetical protein [Burkholderia lata]VWB76182.1 hypothetical protein BLA6993_03600 [Burkholderia lata]